LKMTVMTSFTCKMGLRHFTTNPFAAAPVSICPSAGSDARPRKTGRSFAGHQDRLT
jgi:hypothetical protein